MADRPAAISDPEPQRLRFMTCGSVDDGKSTLIGRLLHDTGSLYADQIEALTAASRRFGTQGEALDLALATDGLAAEREQGITIDVAYRYFATPRRSFVVADAPGHEQYTRNMVTAASHSDLAVILVDASRGVSGQTRRHAFVVGLMGLRHVVLAVTKMDLVGYDEARFEAVVAAFGPIAATARLPAVTAIPTSGLTGENVARAGTSMPWYPGPSLLAHLETVAVDAGLALRRPFRMPVQWVNRPDPAFRGFAGRIASGSVRPGDSVSVLPSGRTATVARIVTFDGDLDRAGAGLSVTLTLAEPVECARGAVIASADAPPEVADLFDATLVWLADAPMLAGRAYLLRIGTEQVLAQIGHLKHRIDVETFGPAPARSLVANDIGSCTLSLDRPVAFAPFDEDPALGAFVLIDRLSNATVGAGTIRFALRRAHNLHWQALTVDKTARAVAKAQSPAVLWFTGLSASGKSTIANLVEKKLHAAGRHTYLLDGDNVRHGLNRDLGFTEADRVENIRRVAEVARLMADAGLIVLVSFISPFRAERDFARSLLAQGEFFEIFVDCPLSVAEARDPKGLYAKARAGTLRNFTGLDSPYEPPLAPDLRVDTSRESAEDAADRVVAMLAGRRRLSVP